MRFDVQCPQCGHVTRLPAAAAGTQRVCLNCGATLLVPQLQSDERDIPVAEIAGQEAVHPDACFSNLPRAQTHDDAQDGLCDTGKSTATAPDSPQVNPFAAPRTISRETAEVDNEPIDFSPAMPENLDVHATPQPVALAFSNRQLRDVLRYAAAIRAAVMFTFAVFVVGLVVDALGVVTITATLVAGVPRELNSAFLVGLGVYLVSALVSGITASILWAYSSRLDRFLTFKRADDLVESLASENRLWQWCCWVIGLGVALTIIVVFIAIAWR